MSLSPDIISLSSAIAAETQKYNDLLKASGVPAPSLETAKQQKVNGDAPSSSSSSPPSADLETLRRSIIANTSMLRNLMLGPAEYLMVDFHPFHLVSLNAITRFNIPAVVPLEGEVSYAEIAESNVALTKALVQSLMRHAIARGIFADSDRPGYVRHNATSRLLATNPGMMDYLFVATNNFWPAGSRCVDAMVKYPGSGEANETGYSLAHGSSVSMYESLAQQPELAQRFAAAMQLFVNNPGYDLEHVAKGFAWGSLKQDAVVVDNGGSHGHVAIYLARLFPGLKFIVQDLPPVVAGADLPEDLKERITFQGHDFFTPQTIVGADIYFFRWILHNWSDKYAIKILQNLASALRPNSLILICDDMMPERDDDGSGLSLAGLSAMDMAQLATQNARVRSKSDWIELLTAADTRYSFVDATHRQGSNMWMLQVSWKG